MLKKIAILSFSALSLIGCDGNTSPQPQTANANISVQTANNSLIVSGHSQAQTSGLSNVPQTAAASAAPTAQKSEAKTKWTQSGTPIDTTAFDAEIAKAEKSLKAKSKDEAAKKALAEAFLKRAMALTEARQYASAIGDYRRVLKYDAGNEEAKTWIDKIIEIYAMINRTYPNEGEEPPPLPFKKA